MAITMEERAQRQQLGFRQSDGDADARLRELILYIAQKCDRHDTFGATKLNKILYYTDFISYARYGESVTGAEYMRLPKGPAPVRLVPIRKDMEAKKEIVIQQRAYYRSIQHRIIAVRPPDLDAFFTARDIALVNEVIDTLSSHTATQVSDLSHGIAWRIAVDRQVIPYEAALLAEPTLRLEDIVEAHQLIRKYGWVDV